MRISAIQRHHAGVRFSGAGRLLGIGGRSRIPSQPNLTTIAEQGAGGHEIQSWSGLFTPRGTPQPVIERTAQEVKVPLNDPTTGERIAESGSWNIWADPQATDAFVRAEFDRWGPIVKQAGMTNG
ncbi:tripartite tricarboxylate transporter substrate-binding protein [Roseomonas gilardii]|uniref:tripartite tricarboxylate transporter substrate-binding protein n=1 Tax=Roseomonas gilardii TaxID=257708 RepID=UPI0009E0186E|nr:tripartite tricarboxylate transporter substrate-binding protein [Roseomonas gilardii]